MNIKNSRFMFFAALSIFFSIFMKVAAIDAGLGVCKVISGDVVAAWQAVDISGNQLVVGATGSVSSNPNTWNLTTLSTVTGSSLNSQPILFSNANGDVLVVWQYFDTNGNYQIAASMLPVGTTTWNSAVVSDINTDAAGFFDQTASIDESGNILLLWTSFDSTFSHMLVRGATATIGSSTTWSSPFTVSN